jgi:hypothetical protein
LPAGTVWTSLIGIRRAVAAAVLVNLWLTAVEQDQQPGVICVIRVIDQGIEQIRGGDRRAVGKVRGVADIESDRVGAVLQQTIREHQIHSGDRSIAKCEVAVCVSAEAVQVESRVGLVIRSVIENDHQSG